MFDEGDALLIEIVEAYGAAETSEESQVNTYGSCLLVCYEESVSWLSQPRNVS